MPHSTYFTFCIALMAILNPIGNAAIFIGMTHGRTMAEQRASASTCSFAVLVILVVSVWLGQAMLALFGISVGDFGAAGGLIVLLIGLSMIRAKTHTYEVTQRQMRASSAAHEPIAVVPMAIPIIAGPGAIATVVTHDALFSSFWGRILESAICAAAAVIVGFVLYLSPWVSRVLGDKGMKIVTRIMGMVICAIAIQMMAHGIMRIFHLPIYARA